MPDEDPRVAAVARALCEYGVITVDGEVATWERHHRKLTQMAQIAMNAADEALERNHA